MFLPSSQSFGIGVTTDVRAKSTGVLLPWILCASIASLRGILVPAKSTGHAANDRSDLEKMHDESDDGGRREVLGRGPRGGSVVTTGYATDSKSDNNDRLLRRQYRASAACEYQNAFCFRKCTCPNVINNRS